jgi:peptide deformylase
MYFVEDFRIKVYGPEMNHVLSKPVDASEISELSRLMRYMVRVMRTASGCGLAAPQVGCFKQVVIIEKNGGEIESLVNPEILRLYGKEIEDFEVCLSLPPPGNGCRVPRLEMIDVEASSVDDPYIRKKLTFRGCTARIVQHELDHLTGTFFVDRVSERQQRYVLESFENWKSQRREQIRSKGESENVNAGFVAARRGTTCLS